MLRVVLLLGLLLALANVHASTFLLEDVEIRGIKKISVGTVLNYLPVKAGDVFDYKDSARVIRELYQTGFFNNIQLYQQDNTLVVEVEERPAIAEVEFTGNKEVNDESMNEALKQIGMTKGKIYNPKLLEKLEQELQQLYYSLSKYAVRLDAKAIELDADRVKIEIEISEGAPARIRSINLIGNRAFSDEELLEQFKLESTDSGLLPSDKYSSVKLSGDLESMKSFYLDQGYVKFNVDSKQVSITPDKKDINIAINVSEGEQFFISKINLTGELVVPEAELLSLLTLREGDVFSRKNITASTRLMSNRLGEEGYAYAQINPIPNVNDDDKTVELTLLVVPGQKMMVRRIRFEGNTSTRDQVLRREMRQMEGAPFSNSKLERSKVRLQRLKYISSVDTKYLPVPDQPDMMDILVTVTERFSGSFTLGIGYSEAQGTLLNLGLTHDNVFGTGNRIGITFNNSDAQEQYEFLYENPYYTADGISRTLSARYTQTDAAEANISNYLLDKGQLSVRYGIPLSEFNKINFQLGLERNDVKISDFTSDEVRNFIIDNNEDLDSSSDFDGDIYDSVFANVSFSVDSRNRLIFPETGQLNSIALELYGGDLEFYKTIYRHLSFFPVSEKVTLAFNGRLVYGEARNATTDLPFSEKFTAGGVRSVRGFEFNSLGPQDSQGDAFGGNFQVIGSSELLFQIDAIGGAETFRLGLYLDIGNVFADVDDFEAEELRASVGLAAKWFTPVGPIALSYANPLNDEPGDETKSFQFSLGAPF